MKPVQILNFAAVLVFGLLVGLTLWMIAHSRKTAVHAGNVNEEWRAESKPGASVPAETVATKA